MKKGLFASLVLLILLGFTFGTALAQNYSFNVDREVVNAYFNADGTTSLDYTIDFRNDPGASPIGYVDLGLPNGNFTLNNITADVNGSPITDISQADPSNLEGSSDGVTLALHNLAIQPGATGTVHVSIPTIEGMVHPYTQSDKQNYASINFMPNYFNSSLAHGNTDLTVSIYLPPAVTSPDAPVYYTPQGGWPGAAQPQSGFDSQGRIYYTWESPDANSYSGYTFGAAFPADAVPAAAIVKQSSITFNSSLLCCFGGGLVFVLIFGWAIYAATVGARKRKLQYLPPKISIEGHGVKRGLTAVEAAILFEEPMDKILTMILFSVVKKNAATVVTRDPLELQISAQPPQDLQGYEKDFLAAYQSKGKERADALQTTMIGLVKSVSEKMKGFSRKETVAYYQDIMQRAWQQVEAAGTPEVKSQKFDEVMDWAMLDRQYDDHTRRAFGGGPVFVPVWWPRYDPVYRGSAFGGAGAPAPSLGGSGKTTINLPNLPGGAFAASMVNSVQAFSAGVIGDLGAFTGGVTNKTNPVPKPTSSSGGWSGGGGGHSCACACACAGCACACAGGGR